VNAWPSFETQLVGGWLLRFAAGYSKRANSATPIEPAARLDAQLADHIIGQFERRRIRPVFRLTGLEDAGVDALLAARGLASIEPSLCLVAPIGPAARLDPQVRIEASASRPWIEQAAASSGGEKANAVTLGAIVSRIANQAAFATLAEDGEDLAWGLAVAERGFVGLYDIVVAPRARGRGLGRRLCQTLMGWGAEQGARTAYLQVRADNAIANALYRTLGFEQAYSYSHRVGPTRDGAAAAATAMIVGGG
jgi:ribosomal protein S18 acetylase RimI-like enzyme